jgi:hypothetical protein
MNIVRHSGVYSVLFAGLLLLNANIARACAPGDGCTECQTGALTACFYAEAENDASDIANGKFKRRTSVSVTYPGSADAGAICAECQSYAGDSAPKKAYCASYMASGVCNR